MYGGFVLAAFAGANKPSYFLSDANPASKQSTITTGVTLDKAIDSVEYYGGHVQGIASVFSFISKARGVEVNSIFGAKDMKGYASYDARVCPMCKAKQKIDAIVNGFGYSKM